MSQVSQVSQVSQCVWTENLRWFSGEPDQMKAEVSIQLLKFFFHVFNLILLVSGRWDTSRRSQDQRRKQIITSVSVPPCVPVPLSVSVLLQLLGISVLSCSLWILFSSGNLLNILPSGNAAVFGGGGVTVAMTAALGVVWVWSQVCSWWK